MQKRDRRGAKGEHTEREKMKKAFLSLSLILLFLSPLHASAFKADPFRGAYEVLSGGKSRRDQSSRAPGQKKYLIVDVDTLANIWTKYGSGPLPADLIPYKDEPSIIAGFTFRDFLILSLERASLIGNGYLSVKAGESALELRRRPDGGFDGAVLENQNVSRYLLSAPQPL